MPADALPVAWPAPLPGAVRYQRYYRDPAGRPLAGKVTITGVERTQDGAQVVVPAAVTVKLVGGSLDVDLSPDTYTLVAELRTVDGVRATDKDTITVGSDQ